ATNENLPPNVIKQLAKELKGLDESPPEGIKVAGTPYENGVFRMKLLLSHDFPHSPPKGYFLTKIFHPNIAPNGEICVNTLKKDWNPSLGLRHVLIPYPESALNEQAGKMLLENYDEYARHARLYTGIHAKPKPKLKSGAICESTTALNVEQHNTSVLNIEQKNAESGAGLSLPSPLAPSSTKGGNNPDHQPQPQQQPIVPATETGVSGTAVVGISGTAPKKEGLSKIPADKKKMDARKKSLKRL
ncbi:hypothetical protein Gohar_014227, partial [Gossypium harknessii]|nr:hypothetical protein [Gossypium harknessii]